MSIPQRAPPASTPAHIPAEYENQCLKPGEYRSLSELSGNLFTSDEYLGKTGKSGGKALKHAKAGKGAKSMDSKCNYSAGKYRTCFHRSDTLNTCDTIISGRPSVEYNEVLISGNMHLTLLEEFTAVTCDKEIQLEKAFLTFLADNVGRSDSAFEPVCAFAVDSAQSRQFVPNSGGDYVESTAFQMEVQFIQKIELRNLSETKGEDIATQLQSRSCTFTDKALCCSQHAINGYVAEHCASLGCSLNGCGSGRRPRKSLRKLSGKSGKSSKGSKGSLFGKSAKAHHNFFEKPMPINACPWYGLLYEADSNEVVTKYTLFDPEETLALVGAKDTKSVADCSANRYSINQFGTPSLPCDDFMKAQCPQNEDLPSEYGIVTPKPVEPTPSTPSPVTR